MAEFDFQHYPMCNALTSYLQFRMTDLNMDNLATLARSFARLGFSSNSVWPLINNRINDLNLSKDKFSEAVTLAWSLTMMDYFPVYTFLLPLFELWRTEIVAEIRALESTLGLENAINETLSERTQLELWELSVNFQAKGHEQVLDDDLFAHMFGQYQALASDHSKFCVRSGPHQQISQILGRWGMEHQIGKTVPEGFYVDIFIPKVNTVIEVPSTYNFSQNRTHVLNRGRRTQIERILRLCGYNYCKIPSLSGWKRLEPHHRESLLVNMLKKQGCSELLHHVQGLRGEY